MASCPVCKELIVIEITSDLITKSKRNPVSFIIEHCNKTLITYIDQNYKVRGIQPVYNLMKTLEPKKPKQLINAQPITPEFINTLTADERIVFLCDSECDEIVKKNIPNVLDKQILNLIHNQKEISLAMIVSKMAPLEKALNRKIDRDLILKLLGKYVDKGYIKRQEVKFEEDLISLASEAELLQKENQIQSVK
jgi:hypothetical protein